jgi:hypothetical protein
MASTPVPESKAGGRNCLPKIVSHTGEERDFAHAMKRVGIASAMSAYAWIIKRNAHHVWA